MRFALQAVAETCPMPHPLAQVTASYLYACLCLLTFSAMASSRTAALEGLPLTAAYTMCCVFRVFRIFIYISRILMQSQLIMSLLSISSLGVGEIPLLYIYNYIYCSTRS